MATAEALAAPPGPGPGPSGRRGATESAATWPLSDRIGLVLCWTAGIALMAVCAAILIFLLVKGLHYLTPNLLLSHPNGDVDQSKSGGILDPLEGTLLLTGIGIAIAAPLGIVAAIWLTEYGRPFGLARLVESGIEVVAGTPSIVIALFGYSLFSRHPFGGLSFTAQGGAIFGRSFLAAGLVMSLLALPLVFSSTREALQSIPGHVREASYALGKTKWATIRRVLVPSCRPAMATGTALGIGRMIGDTAIIVILLGATLRTEPQSSTPVLGLLRGTGSTLTSFTYFNSPVGEGNAYTKAYAAAFVLLILVLLINLGVEWFGRRTVEWVR